MTLDEAIQHATQKGQHCGPCCASEHRQLAAWLIELKELRAAAKAAKSQ